MDIITKYKSFDGVEFLTALDCEEHEFNLKQANLIMSELPDRTDSRNFSNGMGYIQHDSESILKVRNKFLEFCKRYTDMEWIQETIDSGFDVDPSWAGRIIDESAPRSISKLWYRFSCIDKQCREWGQIYYANNPDKAELKRLN